MLQPPSQITPPIAVYVLINRNCRVRFPAQPLLWHASRFRQTRLPASQRQAPGTGNAIATGKALALRLPLRLPSKELRLGIEDNVCVKKKEENAGKHAKKDWFITWSRNAQTLISPLQLGLMLELFWNNDAVPPLTVDAAGIVLRAATSGSARLCVHLCTQCACLLACLPACSSALRACACICVRSVRACLPACLPALAHLRARLLTRHLVLRVYVCLQCSVGVADSTIGVAL